MKTKGEIKKYGDITYFAALYFSEPCSGSFRGLYSLGGEGNAS